MHDVVIVGALRTPTGRFQGAFSTLPATELGSEVLKRLIADAGIAPAAIDEIILGQVLTAGCGQNPARQTALKSGLPYDISATTINKVCGSGLEAIHLAVQALQCGSARIAIAGGQENMSLAPYILSQSRTGMRIGHGEVTDSLIHDGLWDAFNDYHMGQTAENIARQYQISRQEQDAFALLSQQKAADAIKSGRFKAEIVPITVREKTGPRQVMQDEQPRPGTTPESLAALRPAFSEEGSVTAGNASSMNDGAAAVLLMRAETAREMGIPALARIAAYACAGTDPAIMGIAPAEATRRCLDKAGWQLAEVDLIEANEAFAAQALAVAQVLELDTDKLNVNGGAIALGHPVGASGCRILVTLLHEMLKRGASKGLATLCIGGGMGVAMAIERVTPTD
ncbi:acetyl-CoA C-acetyltransferase [Scandinavium sp. H11S7]|uniref:acetyl-CoA C-acetyltransferase n=1 Tax=Scandinavium hiltneri TaxID=2926519 RepID=UPI002166123D|nr:acetyl-CoA C-acetyltransferase [Scandinavium hiltneri]MCS2158937.1 acetyl-CoA C-acetyltransferase [Scandinavium hiltneri]